MNVKKIILHSEFIEKFSVIRFLLTFKIENPISKRKGRGWGKNKGGLSWII